MDGISVKGRFVDTKPEASLMWQPDLARSPSQLLPGLSGRIVYREPPPPPPPVRPITRAAIAGGIMVLGGMGVATTEVSTTTVARPPSSGGPSIHLRTGDTIPCVVTHIDEKGVTFKAPQTAATFVASEKIKSVELRTTSNMSGIDEAKHDRLLTLPRMQRDSPPTHLICSKSGDFLRGHIVEMDESRLKIEVRLKTRRFCATGSPKSFGSMRMNWGIRRRPRPKPPAARKKLCSDVELRRQSHDFCRGEVGCEIGLGNERCLGSMPGEIVGHRSIAFRQLHRTIGR